MTFRTTALITVSLIASSLVSGAAQAALQGRDLDGNAATFEAYYDTDLNITWLDGVLGGGTWVEANSWAATLSIVDTVNSITYDNWRLPTVAGTLGCNFAYTSTDCGYNVDTTTGEMAHLFYDELNNKAAFAPDYNGDGTTQPGYGLTNAAPFSYLPTGYYWYGTAALPGTGYQPGMDSAWYFSFEFGLQYADDKGIGLRALAVSPGDVGIAAVPEVDTWAMLLAGLALVGAAVRCRKQAEA